MAEEREHSFQVEHRVLHEILVDQFMYLEFRPFAELGERGFYAALPLNHAYLVQRMLLLQLLIVAGARPPPARHASPGIRASGTAPASKTVRGELPSVVADVRERYVTALLGRVGKVE